MVDEAILLPEPAGVYPVRPLIADTVQANVAPVTLDVSATAVLEVPEQIDCVDGVAMALGTGCTVTT
jgi:hypothetical protein